MYLLLLALATVTTTGLNPNELAIGHVGKLEIDEATTLVFKVAAVLGSGDIVVEPHAYSLGVEIGLNGQVRTIPQRERLNLFRVQDSSIRGIADNSEVKLTGVYKVAETTKVSGRTMFLLRPASKEETAEWNSRVLDDRRSKELQKLTQQIESLNSQIADARRKGRFSQARALEAERAEHQGRLAKMTPTPKDAPKPPTPVDLEQEAARKLKLAKAFLENNQQDIAKRRLNEIADAYPQTKAGTEAKRLLADLEK